MLVWKKLVGTALLFLLFALVAFGFVPASAQTPVSSATPTATTVNANKVVTATATLTPTATTAPVTATKTVTPSATATKTTVPPSATKTLAPATATQTRVLPTATVTKTLAPSATATKPAATATATKSATATKVPPTATSVPKAVAPRAGVVTSLSTMFAVQNTDPSTTANVTATFYDTAGTAVSTVNKTIAPNLSTTIDQRATGGGLDSFSSWQGSVVLSSNTQLAAVVNQYGGNSGQGTNFRFDSYTGIANTNASTTVLLPQLLKNQFDPGTNTTYNSLLAIQNTANAGTTVTMTFKAFPSGTYSRSFSIPANSSAFIDLQSESALSSVSTFYGSGQITANQPIAVIVNQSGAGSLASYLGYNPSTDATQTLYLPQILKGHFDPGTNLYYNTSILVMSADGETTANFTVTYKNLVDGQTYVSSGQANPSGGLDQRTDPALRNVSWFYGSAVVTADKPIIVVAPFFANYNPSRGIRQEYYRAFASVTGGTTMFAPLLLKNSFDSSSGITWSTGLVGQFMGSNPQTVTLTYYYSDGTTKTSTASVSPSAPMFGWDQRTDPNMTQSMAAAVVTCPEPFAIIVHTFGNNNALGDASGVYSGIK